MTGHAAEPVAAATTSPAPTDTPVLNGELLSGLKFRGLGPAFTSGRVIDFAVHPARRSTYYVAVASGGLWKTTNAGVTFTPVFDNEGSYSIGCVTLDPRNPNTVWVGTGENNSQRSVSFGDGVYRSRDGGQSWENLGLRDSEHIGMIRVDPRDSNVVYVAAQGPLWRPGPERGLYKTTNGGQSWTRILDISENTGVSEVHIHPLDPNILLATSYQRRRHVWTLINGGPESALYKSTDAGATWRRITSGLPDEDKGKIGLAISPANPDYVYAIVEAAGGKGGVFRSIDRGESWERRSDYNTTSGQYYCEIFCHPTVPDRVVIPDTFTAESKDGGKTWQRLPVGNRHVDDHAFWVDPRDTSYWMIGGDGGAYESFDEGATWRHMPNLPVTQFYRVTVDNSKPFYYVYGGTQDNTTVGGPSRTIDRVGIGDEHWFVTVGGDGFETQVDPEDPNIVYSQYQHGGLVRYCRHSGESIDIKPREKPGEPGLRWNWDSPLLISPHNRKRLYFAANILYRSDDQGDSWRSISPDLTRQIDRNTLEVMGRIQLADAVAKSDSTSFYGNIVSLSESPLVEGLLYVGTDDGLVQITEDGGATWRKVESFPGVPHRTYVSAVRASQHDADTIYAGFDNKKMGDFKPYLLRSTDRGRTWASVAGDLPEREIVFSFAEDHVEPRLLFAGTAHGVFATLDGGAKWLRLRSGLPTISVRDIDIQKRENDLVLATFGRGFYVLDDYSPLRLLAPSTPLVPTGVHPLIAGAPPVAPPVAAPVAPPVAAPVAPPVAAPGGGSKPEQPADPNLALAPELLKKDAAIFPIKDALHYVEANRLGGRNGRGWQGSTYWSADNPPFGATITFYLKDKPLSRREQRHDAEKQAVKDGRTPAYPSVEQLREEDESREPQIVLVIRNAAGEVVRRLLGPREKGIHRIAWDLRYPASDPTDLTPPDKSVPWGREPDGPLVSPGEYSVTVAKEVDGVMTEIAGPEKVKVISLNLATFAAKDKEALLAFQQKVARLQRAVLGALRSADEAQGRIAHVRKALLDTPHADPALLREIESLQQRLYDLLIVLRGDPTRDRRNEPRSLAILDRVGAISGDQWYATSPPTKTQEDGYTFAADAFEEALAELRAMIEKELVAIEGKLEQAGAPWTPGRVPTWRRE